MDFASTFASINEFGGVDFAPHNKGVTPIFFIEAVQDFAASEREGRAVYVDKERVRIHVVGDQTAAAAPVDAAVIARFRDQYEAWKRKETGSHIKGTPLKKWPMSTPAMIRELESWNVFSVEDLAAISDGNVQNITDGRAMRDRAAAWLKSAADGAAVMKYAAEVNRLRDEVAELKKVIIKLGGKEVPAEALPRAKERALKSSSPRRVKKAKRKAGWTPERRAKQAEILRARMAAKKESADIQATRAQDYELA
jgi:hypothetical protein